MVHFHGGIFQTLKIYIFILEDYSKRNIFVYSKCCHVKHWLKHSHFGDPAHFSFALSFFPPMFHLALEKRESRRGEKIKSNKQKMGLGRECFCENTCNLGKENIFFVKIILRQNFPAHLTIDLWGLK